MNQFFVSVIIPNYNYGRFLRQAIDSALAQTYQNIEIIVADDGSTDDSDQIIESYGTRIRSFKQANAGVSAVRNRAFAEARGELVALLDSDDIWLPDKLEKQVKLFADNEIGLVHCGCQDFDETGNLEQHLNGLAGWVAVDLLRYQRPVILGGGSAVVLRKTAIERAGGFDEKLRIGEDWEFYYRVARVYKVGFVPEILLKYRRHGNNHHANAKRMAADMIYAYDKIFTNHADELKDLKPACYGRIHTIIAGSSFRAGNYSDFLKHAAKGVWLAPENFTQFAKFPLRWLRRNSKTSDARLKVNR